MLFIDHKPLPSQCRMKDTNHRIIKWYVSMQSNALKYQAAHVKKNPWFLKPVVLILISFRWIEKKVAKLMADILPQPPYLWNQAEAGIDRHTYAGFSAWITWAGMCQFITSLSWNSKTYLYLLKVLQKELLQFLYSDKPGSWEIYLQVQWTFFPR